MPSKRDYYEVLNVERTATETEIKRAYRKAAMKFHPDRNPDDPDAEARFKEAAEAFEVLSDPEKRQRYDRFGHEGLRGAGMHDFSGMGASDIFSMFEDLFGDMGFGGRRGGGARRGRRGYDLETEIEIDLAEAAEGVEREVEFSRRDACQTCDGSGAKPGSLVEACGTCGGQGRVAVRQGFFQMVRTCPDCQGAGQIVREKCGDCGGSGRRPLRRTLNVRVPPGIQEGQVIRAPGEGEPGDQGGPRGDLHVVVHVAEHDLFEREGDHLVLPMPISFAQAALGDRVEVPTLGESTELEIPRGTQHGATFRIRGEGMPNLRSGRRGDLVVRVLIEVPRKLTKRQEELLSEFAETEDHQVMPQSKGFFEKLRTYIAGQ